MSLVENLMKQLIGDEEILLPELIVKQEALLQSLQGLNFSEHQRIESILIAKMNIYRSKLKRIKSDMLYIQKRASQLATRTIEIQAIKVNEKAAKERRVDYEKGLINNPKKIIHD